MINKKPHSKPSRPYIALILAIIFIATSVLDYFPVEAQLSDEAWTEPFNLSKSGAASNPAMVVDSSGIIHVVWEDEFSGYVYSSGDGIEWTPPVATDFPWETKRSSSDPDAIPITPRLYPDAAGYIHAFWISVDNILYYSRVLAEKFGSPNSWLSRQRMADDVFDLSLATDASGGLHLAYVKTKEKPDLPAGIYYQSASGSGYRWSLPAILYNSPYFRSLTVDTAHVAIQTASVPDGEHIYVVWDNPARERVYFVRSVDGGETWEQPMEVDTPEEGTTAAGPSDILISASAEKILLLWQAEHTGSSCVQYYRTSTDGGATWQERLRKPEDLLDCPNESDLMEIDETQVLLFSVIQDQVYLQAWDGSKWSDPQLQDILTSFPDPETRRLVQFGCYQPILVSGGNLFIAGCDQGDGQDIWWLKRQLVDVADWFPKDAVWNPLINIASGSLSYLSPVLISENGEKVHAFWSQTDPNNPTGPGASIYYARWEGRQWSQPVAVLTSPTGKTDQPAVALDPSGHFYAVWSGADSGQIYFSQAASSQAVLATAWEKPKLIPSPQPSGSSPDILISPGGRIYIAYAIPLNEGRGIYVTYSDDKGETWAEPVQVFDGVGAGWAMVDKPQLAMTGNNDLHLLWTRYSLPAGSGPLGLYSAHSTDGGKTWLPPTAVVDKPVVWSRMIGKGDQTVHRLWQELSSGRTTLWHEASLSNGAAWTRTAPASIFGETVGTPSVTYDQAGQLHLFQAVRRSPSTYVLQHWRWDGETWVAERSLDLNLKSSSQINNLSSVASSDGNLFVVFSDSTINRQTGFEEDELFFASRSFQLPENVATQVQAAAPTPEPTLTPTPELLPIETPTAEIPATSVALNAEPPQSGNSLIGSVLVPVAAGLIVLVAILIGIRMRRT